MESNPTYLAALEEKLENLKNQLEQLKSNLSFVAGAIQFCEHLIAEAKGLGEQPAPEPKLPKTNKKNPTS